MSYGIKIVTASRVTDETKDRLIGFSMTEYQQVKDDITVGTRMLLYETDTPKPGSTKKGEQVIFSEVEVVKEFAQAETPEPKSKSPMMQVRVRILRPRSTVQAIPLTSIRKLLRDENFPAAGGTWIPLEEKRYNIFLMMWS